MPKISENNGTEEIGLVTPTPEWESGQCMASTSILKQWDEILIEAQTSTTIKLNRHWIWYMDEWINTHA